MNGELKPSYQELFELYIKQQKELRDLTFQRNFFQSQSGIKTYKDTQGAIPFVERRKYTGPLMYWGRRAVLGDNDRRKDVRRGAK